PFDARGVVVVGAEGFAARIGFRPGDILKQINGHDIGDVNDAVAAAARKTRSWQLTINRGGKILSMRFQG
ncbi:MAG: PDZ domain-containing protein, partial [Paracoccaceae bacterium]